MLSSGRDSKASLRSHVLRSESSPLPAGRNAAIQHGHQPDSAEADDHREKARVIVWEQRLAEAERLHPDGLAQDHHDDSADETQEATDKRSPRRQAWPEHREQQHREVAGSRHGEEKTCHKSHVLVLEDIAENYCK